MSSASMKMPVCDATTKITATFNFFITERLKKTSNINKSKKGI